MNGAIAVLALYSFMAWTGEDCVQNSGYYSACRGEGAERNHSAGEDTCCARSNVP
jgi:hypothetical protein